MRRMEEKVLEKRVYKYKKEEVRETLGLEGVIDWVRVFGDTIEFETELEGTDQDQRNNKKWADKVLKEDR